MISVFEEKIDFHFKEIKLLRNLPEDVSDIKGYLRITTNFPSLDRVVSDLKRQFAENDNDNLCFLCAIIFDNDPENGHIKKVAKSQALQTFPGKFMLHANKNKHIFHFITL